MQRQQVEASSVDDSLADDLVTLLDAERACDAPHEPPATRVSLQRFLRYGWDGDGPERLWLLRDETGTLVARSGLQFPQWDNRHIADVEISVHPLARRTGVGARLLAEALVEIRAAGRTLAVTGAWSGTPGEPFLRNQGFTLAQVEEKRRLDLDTLDFRQIDLLYADSAAVAAGYDVVQIAGPSPPDLLDSMVDLFNAINDSPLDDLELDHEVFGVERLRCFDTAQTAMGQRLYRVLARCRRTGAWAGHSLLAVDPSRPAWGFQYDTSVLEAHRGNRLGLLLKTSMLRWLRDREPQLQWIDTWNAASNTPMITVNDVLGCFLVSRATVWQRRL